MNPRRTSLARLVGDLHGAGIVLSVEGDRLAVSPKGLLTPEIRTEIVRFRDDLIEAVRVHGSDLLTVFAQETNESVSSRLSPSGPGWAAVRSYVLGETIVFVRDDSVLLPPEAARFVTYTRAELEILSTATREVLRQMHGAKKHLGCSVISLNTLSNPEADRTR